jgi:hypothetical protein
MNHLSFGDLGDWAFNPLHPLCIKLVTATMLATTLAQVLLTN